MLVSGRVLGNSGEFFGVTLSKVVGDLLVRESKGHALNHLVHVYSLLVDDGCKTRCHTPTFFFTGFRWFRFGGYTNIISRYRKFILHFFRINTTWPYLGASSWWLPRREGRNNFQTGKGDQKFGASKNWNKVILLPNVTSIFLRRLIFCWKSWIVLWTDLDLYRRFSANSPFSSLKSFATPTSSILCTDAMYLSNLSVFGSAFFCDHHGDMIFCQELALCHPTRLPWEQTVSSWEREYGLCQPTATN